ncbi:MAG: HAMP domain-containing protein, partial [Proteobacteria bacterium]|nr:HAMP domain-containing protein [Pseudomonadota bacterium]
MIWFFRSIRSRIVAAFLAAMLAMLGATGFMIIQFHGVSESLAMITEGYLPLKDIVGRLGRDQQRVGNDVERLVRDAPRPGTGRQSPTIIYTDVLRQDLEVGRIHARQARHQAATPEEQAALNKILLQFNRIEKLFSDYQEHSSEFVALAESGHKEQSNLLIEPLRRDNNDLANEIDTLGRLVDGRIDSLTRATEKARAQATAVASGLSGLAFLFNFALIAAVLYAIRPIGRLTAQVQRLAAGDYSGQVEVRGADEIALLAGEFNGMVRALELRDRTLVERAEELNRLSRYLASVLDSLEDALVVVESGNVTLANPAASTWGVETGQPPPAMLVLIPGRHELTGPNKTLQEVRVTPLGSQGVVVIAADITEQTLAKERLARSERLALVGQMLAQITHEVRNPLNALSLNAELLAEELGQLDPK